MALINCLNILTAQAANTITDPIFVGDFKTIQLAITGAGGADFTFRALGATRMSPRLVDTQPDFGSAASASNPWDYIFMQNMQDAVNYNGDTGIVFASNVTEQVEINVEGISWIGFQISSYVAGNVTVEMTVINRDQQ